MEDSDGIIDAWLRDPPLIDTWTIPGATIVRPATSEDAEAIDLSELFAPPKVEQ